MLKKVLSAVCCLAILATAVTGCSKAGAADKAGGGKQVNLVFAAWGDSDTKKAEDADLVGFHKKHPNINVKAIFIPSSDYDTKITTMVAAHQQLDVTEQESATIAYPLYEQGKIEPLNKYIEADPSFKKSDIVDSAFYMNNSNIVGIYWGAEVMTLFYSKKAFADAGISAPPADPGKAWTWDEFVNAAKKLTIDKSGKNATQPGFDPKGVKQYGFEMGKWWASWGNFVYSNGGDYITDANKFGLSQPAAYEAIQKVADLANVEHVAPTPVAEKGLPGIDVALASGQYAMGIDGQWNCLNLGNANVDFGTAALPVMKKPVVQAISGMLSIMKDSNSKDESWMLLKYLGDPGVDIKLFKTGNLMPIQKAWLTQSDLLSKWTGNAAHPAEYKDSVINSLLNYSVPSPTGKIKNFNKIMDVVNPALDNVWLGKTSAEAAMKGIESKVDPLIQGRR